MLEHSGSPVVLFTPEEHAILARWLDVEPPSIARDIDVEEAIARLGFTDEPGYRTLLDVAAATIVLKDIAAQLPQFIVFQEGKLIRARPKRDRTGEPQRRIILLRPQLLCEINWADNGPGFSWPVAYYVTWVPSYERFVVTASADSPDALGYCDFALGAFGIETPIKEGSCAIIRADWEAQRGELGQHRWEYLFRSGLISTAEAAALADIVWSGEPNDYGV